ncbi:hypothetical protein CDL12_06045 [Handroanthus impetiginosus]|uniref:Uncharacterized protein n=1 Tax=Handroanthus impetiginosus TaxID=429701 RepID=A0A2G9HUR2_9LAMI|nr:hypothetical protein CDL12_06045 [Handroanthus impetiginosus]
MPPNGCSDSLQPSLNHGYTNMLNNNSYNSLSFEEKPQTNFSDDYCATNDVGLKPLTPMDGTNVYFSSDQGSNSFDCSDFTWGDNCSKTPEISSVLSAVSEDDQAQFVEDASPAKKQKSRLEDLVPSDVNSVNKLPDDLSEFDSQMKLFQMPYLDNNWDASFDAFLSGGATQDGANATDLWSFDDVSAMMDGGY